MELTLENSYIHRDLCDQFKNIEIDQLINYYFIGNKSCGKRTFINMFISNLVSNPVKTTLKTYQLKTNNNTIEVEYRSSNYHYELNIYEYGLYDKVVLSEFVKLIGETKSISSIPFKILVLYGFDKTNKLAQLSLRRMIETYSSNLRIFLVGNSYSKVDKAILSRFKSVHINFPSKIELSNLINSISPESDIDEIINLGNNDLNRIIFLSKLANRQIDITHFNPSYNKIITDRLLHFIFNEKWTKISEIREFLLNIVLLNINLSEVLREIAIEIVRKVENKAVILEIVSETDRIANIITWNIFTLEYFLLKIKSILNLSNP